MIVTLWLVVTDRTVTVNAAELEPLAILTEAGTVAAEVIELLSVTVSPAEGAGALSVTFPATVVVDPPTTLVGETVTLATVIGVIARTAVTLALPNLAVIVAAADDVTEVVVIVKVAVVLPDATVTLVGSTALELLDDSVTVVPLPGAGAPSVTVPVEEFPPTTEVGDTVTLTKVGAVTVNGALREAPL